MTKTLDLIKRFDRQAYYNTEPFKRALADNPSAKSFAIVVANNANGFAFVPVHLKRFIGNKTIIGTIERPEPNVALTFNYNARQSACLTLSTLKNNTTMIWKIS